MLKALEKLNFILKLLEANMPNKKKIEFINQSCNEAIAELEEKQKENKYIHQKMKESLSMGSKAQSLAMEAYRIIDNRVNEN